MSKAPRGRGAKLLEYLKKCEKRSDEASSSREGLDEAAGGAAEESTSRPSGLGRGALRAPKAEERGDSKGVRDTAPKEVEPKKEKQAQEVSQVTKQLEKVSLQGKEEQKVERAGPVIKRGETGLRASCAVNFVALELDPGKGVFEYSVTFSPEVEYTAFRYKLINEHFKMTKGIRCYDGAGKLYMPEQKILDQHVIKSKHPVDESDVEITLTFLRKMLPTECGQLYNVLFNNISKALHFTRLGRQFYDYSAGRSIPQHKLEVWPGYITSVEEFEGGIQLCCDIRHRVLRTDTAYDVIQSLVRVRPEEYKQHTLKELLGQCVLTRYNNSMYRIDDIDWDRNPLSTFKLASGDEISFLEYYKKQYNVDIKDLKQPLLIHRPKRKRDPRTLMEEKPRLVCLVPELCYLTGLTDKMKRDIRVMKEIAMYTRVTPAQRHYGFKKFLQNIGSNHEAQQMLADWGLKMAEDPLQIEARLLPRDDLILQKKLKHSIPESMEWSRSIRDNGVFRGSKLSQWLLIFPKKNGNLARTFMTTLMKTCPGLGLEISAPVIVCLTDDKIDTYIQGIIKNVNDSIQLVVCLCPTQREDRYAAIKRLCCRDLAVPSQVVCCTTIAKENRIRSVVQNVALQINNKVGGASWAISIPLRNTMICGIDSYNDAENKYISVGAFVASLDPELTNWFSKVTIQSPKQELVDGLVCSFALALKKYAVMNNVLPDRIVIYRDGVGDGQLDTVRDYEIAQFLDTFKIVSKNYKPKFSFIVVQKRINAKIFLLGNGRKAENAFQNPPSGCVVDHTINRRNFYDFFLVSQHVSCGTATPTHYIVLYDTSELRPDIMQRLTYKCCHMYYNWAGPIRVPAACQYAHKLATLVGQSIKSAPHEDLDESLYYL